MLSITKFTANGVFLKTSTVIFLNKTTVEEALQKHIATQTHQIRCHTVPKADGKIFIFFNAIFFTQKKSY
jgi:hypothetical protein